jgi:SCY1-like protein 1
MLIQIVPALCQTLTDTEEPVRKQGFKVVRGFVDKLELVSDDPSLREEMESEVQKSHSDASKISSSASGWASWAVGAIGAKFYKSSMVSLLSDLMIGF